MGEALTGEAVAVQSVEEEGRFVDTIGSGHRERTA